MPSLEPWPHHKSIPALVGNAAARWTEILDPSSGVSDNYFIGWDASGDQSVCTNNGIPANHQCPLVTYDRRPEADPASFLYAHRPARSRSLKLNRSGPVRELVVMIHHQH